MDNKLYEEGLDNQKLEIFDKDAIENALNFYNDHMAKLEKAYDFYKEFKKDDDSKLNQNYDLDEFENELNGCKNIILVLTSNDIEKVVLLNSLYTYTKNKIELYDAHDMTFYIVSIGNYKIVHVHTINTGDEYARRTINCCTEIFQPKVIVLLGICYGLNYMKQNLGDVLISNFIKGYTINFRDNDSKYDVDYEPVVQFEEAPNRQIIKRINNFNSYFHYKNIILDGSNSFDVSMGTLLSANSLMSSKIVKDNIVKAFGTARPHAIGGEMEVTGVFKSNIFEKEDFNDWIVIKSICDWGESKNSLSPDKSKNEEIKDSLQAFAMLHSVSVFISLIEHNKF